MTVTGSRVTVAATATVIAASDRQSLLIKNLDASASIDLGGSGVTSGAGFPLPAGASVALDMINPAGAVYGIAASGTVAVAVLKLAVS